MSSPKSTDAARLRNDFGADYWVRNPDQERRRSTAGRGLFAGLQDTKHYNVESGWARRKSSDSPGLLASFFSRFTGGSYHPPSE